MNGQHASQGLEVRACFCIGPQNGEPACPCQVRQMRMFALPQWFVNQSKTAPTPRIWDQGEND